MRGAYSWSVRRTGLAAASAIILSSVPAFGQRGPTTVEPPAPAETFAYTTPYEPKPLRALLELGVVLTLGFAWYATSAPTVHRWDPGYRWATFKQKITGVDVATDANSFGTNFIGHPLGGTGYYLAARSNRLTIWQSAGFAVAGSLLWEVFGEVSEVVSVNDMITTPLAGISIGEATTQLAAHFDRSEPTVANRVLGSLFGPVKSLNDALDGLEPARAPRGSPAHDWHRFHLEAAGTFAHTEPQGSTREGWWPEARFEANSRIVRLPGYVEAGHDSHWFDDANVSSIALTASVGSAGLSDFGFETQVVLAGSAYRALGRDPNGNAWGGNGFAGLGSGFQYTLHQYRRAEGRAMDRIASVRPFALVFEQRGALGGPVLVTSLELGPDFGGVTPVAIAGFRQARSALPPVQAARGYYFGVGGHLRASVALESGPLRAGGELQAQGFRDMSDDPHPVGVPLADSLMVFGGTLGYADPATGAMPRAFIVRRIRAGSVGDARESRAETTLGFGVGAVF